MNDESLLEWAAGWVEERRPGFRQRFLKSLADELADRREVVASLETQLAAAKAESETWAKRWGWLRDWLKATGPFYTTTHGYGDLGDLLRDLEGRR